eukprot:4962712-Pyramimonas_sp.AAC.1
MSPHARACKEFCDVHGRNVAMLTWMPKWPVRGDRMIRVARSAGGSPAARARPPGEFRDVSGRKYTMSSWMLRRTLSGDRRDFE